MPDEALKASLQGRPRQAPDFSPLALAHLHTSCLAVRQLIKQYLSTPTASQLESLHLAVKDIHYTLQLLDRHGAVLVTSEMSALLDAMANNAINDSDACAHSLVFAGERLADYVAHLQKPGAIDSALPLLPVINNCRACRGEELMSEMLVVASGIDLPDASELELPSSREIAAFINSIKASRQPLMKGIVGWFTDSSALNESLKELAKVFSRLSEHCDAPTSLQPLVPLFDSAEFICQSVEKGALDNSAALHKLFAQLERLLDGYSKLEFRNRDALAKPVPERLFLNMLYYVALSTETSPKAVALRRRFRLDRFISKGMGADSSQVVFDGVGDRLADSIRDAIESETKAARDWLDNPQRSTKDLHSVRDHLAQLEPAMMLLGAPDSLRQIALVNRSIKKLAKTEGEPETQLTERTADALVRLERSLDKELNAVRARNTSAQHSDLESILAACLTEAQSRLLEVEDNLVALFGSSNGQLAEPVGSQTNERTTGHQSEPIKIAEVNAKLSLINSSLQVLPLPEVSPLIIGVQEFIARHENSGLSRSAHRDLATVMVSLGYYLNSVLQPNGAAGQLLLEAEEALLKLDIEGFEINDDTLADTGLDTTLLINGGASQNQPPIYRSSITSNTENELSADNTGDADATFVDYTLDTEAMSFIEVSLQELATINSTLFEYEQAGFEGQTEMRSSQRHTLISSYKIISREASDVESRELVQLAEANIRLLESGNDTADAQILLEESSAVLPQLINQMHSSSDKVHGLQALLDQLHDAALDDTTLAIDVQNILASDNTTDLTVQDTQTLALDNDHLLDDREISVDGIPTNISFDIVENTGDLADNLTGEDFAVMTLDNTLEQVFFRECDQHMLSLRKSVNDALASNKWENDAQRAALNISSPKAGVDIPDIAPASALPSRDMLRALHTLTGSAQTVDAQGVIAIAQPLQKAALQKQRIGEQFNRAETEYVGELLDILQARLDAMEADEPFTDDNDAVMARLHDFVSRSVPWVPEAKSGLQINSDVGSIQSVFEEEARELLENLRSESERLADDDQRDNAIEQILSRLHTIKGSARMAGQPALADRAHQLEDEIRLADGAVLDQAVFNGLGELQTLMLVEVPAVSVMEDQTAALADNTISDDASTLKSATQIYPAQTTEQKRSEPMGLTENSFDNMLSLATRATVSQAKLGESLLLLREACQNIESSSMRLQRLPHENLPVHSAAVSEMLNDLDNAQRMLADALLDAEAEHTHGSRADASLHQTLIHAQLVSFAESQPRLAHAATDAANETAKQVVFQLLGGELNIDKATHRKLMIPLEHLIRNAVVHGIEAEAERSASGKPMQGTVLVEAKIDGTDLLIEVSDDGNGIDANHLLAKHNEISTGKKPSSSSKKDLKTPQLSADKVLSILCEPGFTTHESADQLSGRGLGLASVKQLVDELNGTLHLSLPPEGGCVFALRIPQKIRINQTVLVEHHGRLFAIPVNFVHTVSDEQPELANADIHFNGNDYSCCSLDAILNSDAASNAESTGKRVILIGVHNKHIALLVDKVVGYREVIAQPLGAQLNNLKRYLGGAVLADGRQVLIPDLNRLVSIDSELPVPNWSPANAPVLSRTALVVDDSITMRIAAEQMLHSVDIVPSFARDGAEAVELVSDALPDVLLVDIDMPRMNGFDFLQHLSIVHPNHAVPIVMISTRDTQNDREKAQSLGAQYYLVKPYKEEELKAVLTDAGLLS